jgi:ribosomal-protein-alanine N-acetyltransferase
VVELEFSVMRRRDLRPVMVIEHAVFPEPWSLAIFHSELALRRGRAYRVARAGREVAGYFGLMFVEDEGHLTTIAVAPAFWRQGVATQMMLEAMAITREHGARHLSLEVAAGNERAQALYRRFGFAPVGVRKGYYAVTGEDAYVMWAYDVDSEAYAERLLAIASKVRSS